MDKHPIQGKSLHATETRDKRRANGHMVRMQTSITCKLKIDRNIILVPRQVLYSSLSLILLITLLSGSRAGLVSVILTVVFYHHW